ncbi:MAG: hypothetical protein KAI81_07420 [Candidatus Marinimicrobia bacterium]|nr:hypothetical protein [Candidatus Neomarinimicrobiota bacterium]
MSDVIDGMKKNLNVWWKEKGPKVEDMLKHTAKKTEELTHKAKLKYEIFQAERDLEKKFSEIGEYVHNKIRNEDIANFENDSDISGHIEAVKDIEEKIQNLRAEYLKVGKAEDLSHEESTEDDNNKEEDKAEPEVEENN